MFPFLFILVLLQAFFVGVASIVPGSIIYVLRFVLACSRDYFLYRLHKTVWH